MRPGRVAGPTVAVMRGGALGDFVLTMPAIEALRRAWPQARLVLLAHARYAVLAGPGQTIDLDGAAVAGLFARAPKTDAAPSGDAAPASGPASPGGRTPRTDDTELVGTEPIDAGLRQVLGQTSLLLAYSTDTSGVLARNLNRWVAGRVQMADPRPAVGARDHQTAHLAAPLRALGIPVASLVPRVRVPLPPWPPAGARPHRPAGPLVVLHPGSGGRSKRWPLDCYLDLAGRLRQHGCVTRLVCGPAEEDLEPAEPDPPLRPASPLELAAVLARADLFVGNDSGPAHLAAAMGTRTLALFGPTDPRIWRPLAPWATVLRPESGELAALGVDCVLERVRALLRTPSTRVPREDG